MAVYFDWMLIKEAAFTKGHALMTWIWLVLPVLIIVSLIFTLAAYFLGIWSGYLLAAILLWLSLDARDLTKHPYFDAKAAELFIITYHRLFAILFWFAVFAAIGFAPGLLIYGIVLALKNYLQQKELLLPVHPNSAPGAAGVATAPISGLLKYTDYVLSWLDWIPLRLVGLTDALAGQFSTVFKLWCPYLLKGPSNDLSPLTDWGLAALNLSKQEAQKQTHEVVGLLDRVLIIWLAIILLFTLGFLLG